MRCNYTHAGTQLRNLTLFLIFLIQINYLVHNSKWDFAAYCKKLLEQLLYQDYSKEDLPEISGQKGQMSNSRFTFSANFSFLEQIYINYIKVPKFVSFPPGAINWPLFSSCEKYFTIEFQPPNKLLLCL